MRIWVGIAAGLIATQCHGDIAADVEDNFRSWLSESGITVGTLAIMQGQQVVHEVGIGTAPDTTREMASLSKAITGVCVLSLIDDGLWSADTTVSSVLGQGPEIAVKQLLTHSSGLTQDSTQISMQSQLDHPAQRTDIDAIFARGSDGPANQFAYNNENYAILGAMIEAQTGKTYQDACSTRALAPAGVTAKLSRRSGAFDAFGGWAMRAVDYAQFYNFHFRPGSKFGGNALNLPKIKVGSSVYYGPGVSFRPWGEGANFWHFGALFFSGRLNVGSFAVQYEIGWTVVATYDGWVDWDAMGQLDRTVTNAIFERDK